MRECVIDNEVLELVDFFGNKRKYDIMFSFNSNDLGKKCIVYTDYSENSEGKINIYSAICNEIDGKINLDEISTKSEIDFICKVLDNIC